MTVSDNTGPDHGKAIWTLSWMLWGIPNGIKSKHGNVVGQGNNTVRGSSCCANLLTWVWFRNPCWKNNPGVCWGVYNPHILLARWEAERRINWRSHTQCNLKKHWDPAPKQGRRRESTHEKLFSAPSLYPHIHTHLHKILKKKNQNILIIFAFDVAEERIYCWI